MLKLDGFVNLCGRFLYIRISPALPSSVPTLGIGINWCPCELCGNVLTLALLASLLNCYLVHALQVSFDPV